VRTSEFEPLPRADDTEWALPTREPVKGGLDSRYYVKDGVGLHDRQTEALESIARSLEQMGEYLSQIGEMLSYGIKVR